MGGAWSAQVEIYFVSSLAWGVFFNTGWDTFYVLADMGGVWSTQVEIKFFFFLACMGLVCLTQVEIYFVFSLAWEGFEQHMLTFILFPRWYGKGLV